MANKVKMSLLIIAGITIVGLLTSCGTIDKIEASHYMFYQHTRALIVVKEHNKKLYCCSPTGISFYRIIDKHNKYGYGDTIDLFDRNNEWVYAKVKFIKEIP